MRMRPTGKDQRTDQRLIGLHRAGDREAGRRGEDRAGKPAADHQIDSGQGELAAPGIDHGGSDVRRLYVIHVPAPMRKASRNGVIVSTGSMPFLLQRSKLRAS